MMLHLPSCRRKAELASPRVPLIQLLRSADEGICGCLDGCLCLPAQL